MAWKGQWGHCWDQRKSDGAIDGQAATCAVPCSSGCHAVQWEAVAGQAHGRLRPPAPGHRAPDPPNLGSTHLNSTGNKRALFRGAVGAGVPHTCAGVQLCRPLPTRSCSHSRGSSRPTMRSTTS